MLQSAADFIRKHDDVILLAHVSPDGDTLGSCLALSMAMRKAGKHVQVVCEDSVPDKYKFLPSCETILKPEDARSTPVAIAVDCADLERTGSACPLFSAAEHTLCVDHHGTNTGFADVNYIQRAGATGELIIRILEKLDWPLDQEMGDCLYVAIASDTGNFSYNGTTPDTFRMMAKVLESGINLSELNRKLYRSIPYSRIKLESVIINKLQMSRENKIAVSFAVMADYEKCGARDEDSEGIIDRLRDINTVEAAAFLRETADGPIRVSLRGKRTVDVSAIASRHNGGGHKLAAGCTLHMPMEEALRVITEELQKALDDAE